jgi:hypothetical protein
MQSKHPARIGNYIGAALMLLSAAVSGFLLYVSLRYLVTNRFDSEAVTLEERYFWGNLLICAGALALAAAARGIARKQRRGGKEPSGVSPAVRNAVLAVCCVLLGTVCVLWIRLLQMPLLSDDSGICYSAALAVRDGDYAAFLYPGGYLSLYPQQFGMIAMNLLSFAIGGEGAYVPFRYLNAAMLTGAYAAGALLVRRLEARYADRRGSYRTWFAEPLWLLLGLLNLPAIWYVNYLYGEIASLSAMLIATWALAEYAQSRHMRWLLPAALAVCVGVLLRKNTIIFVIAAGIALLLHALLKKQWKSLVIAAVLAVCSFLPLSLLQAYAARDTGVEVSDGIPPQLFIAMGRMDDWIGPGWYNDYNAAVYRSMDGDAEMAALVGSEKIREQSAGFRADPAYARDFYLRKVASQWAEPSYDGFYCCLHCDSAADPDFIGWINEVVGGSKTERTWRLLDLYQALIYLGIFLGSLFALGDCIGKVRRREGETDFLLLIPWITLIGGFLFSILWEAKSRYIIEYVTLLIPVACMGYLQAGEWVTGVLTRRAGDRKETCE